MWINNCRLILKGKHETLLPRIISIVHLKSKHNEWYQVKGRQRGKAEPVLSVKRKTVPICLLSVHLLLSFLKQGFIVYHRLY